MASNLEAEAILQLRAHKLPIPICEYRFYEKRRWRADLAWIDEKLIAEIDGGHWIGGRHNRGKGYDADCEKLNVAVVNGWRVLRITSTHLKNGQFIEWVKQALGIKDDQ